MSKVAFIFPGQGSQYVGMGEDFYNTYPCAKEVFDTASKVSGVDLKHLCFEENEDIHSWRKSAGLTAARSRTTHSF